MNFLVKIALPLQRLLDSTRSIDFLAPLLLRIYLAPVFWVAGNNKLNSFEEYGCTGSVTPTGGWVFRCRN